MTWRVAPGEYDVLIENSSQDVDTLPGEDPDPSITSWCPIRQTRRCPTRCPQPSAESDGRCGETGPASPGTRW